MSLVGIVMIGKTCPTKGGDLRSSNPFSRERRRGRGREKERQRDRPRERQREMNFSIKVLCVP